MYYNKKAFDDIFFLKLTSTNWASTGSSHRLRGGEEIWEFVLLRKCYLRSTWALYQLQTHELLLLNYSFIHYFLRSFSFIYALTDFFSFFHSCTTSLIFSCMFLSTICSFIHSVILINDKIYSFSNVHPHSLLFMLFPFTHRFFYSCPSSKIFFMHLFHWFTVFPLVMHYILHPFIIYFLIHSLTIHNFFILFSQSLVLSFTYCIHSFFVYADSDT